MFITRPKVRCYERDFCKEDLREPRQELFDKERRELPVLEEETLSFSIEDRDFY